MTAGAASVTTLYVCVTCRRAGDTTEEPRAGARLLDALQGNLGPLEAGVRLVGVECLSNCTRGCTVAVTGPGKWTYVVGDLDADQTSEDILVFARLHQAAPDGLPAWRERPQHIRRNTIARVPPLTMPARNAGAGDTTP